MIRGATMIQATVVSGEVLTKKLLSDMKKVDSSEEVCD